MIKKCRKCQKDKPLNEMVKSKNHKDGFRSLCKSCHVILVRERQIKNKEKIKEYKKKYRIDNIDKITEQNKQYYKNNKNKAR